MAIHPTAIIDPQAEVHADARIGPFCVIHAGVIIDADVELKNNVTVFGRCHIGKGTIVFPYACIASDPQDLKYRGEDSEVIIGEGNKIHEYVTISKGTTGGGMKTVIGNECLIMAYAHVAHDCVLDSNIVLGNAVQLAGHVQIGRKAIVSGLAGIHHFVSIGELAFVAGMSAVKKDVPPYMMMEGNPAEVRNLNLVGLRRDGWTQNELDATKEAYRIMYHNKEGKALSETVEEVSGLDIGAVKPVSQLCDWLRNMLDGSIKGRLQESARSA